MPVNVFEGARRVALVLKVLWVGLCLIVVFWIESPYVALTYETQRPSAPFVRVRDSCDSDSAREYISRSLNGDKKVNITLCFKAENDFSDGVTRVVYREEGEHFWGGRPYSSEVTKYTEARAAQFTLPEEDGKAAILEWNKERRNRIFSGLGYALGGWVAITLLSAVIGWIVRGFLGIPKGRDRRPEPT